MMITEPTLRPIPDRHCIARARARINCLVGATGLQLALAIGQVVIEELYAGDLDQWRSRGVKEHTLRELATDPDLGISVSALFRAIAIYELKCRMPDHPFWEELPLSHVRAVIGLPDAEQRRLLERAGRERLSCDELEEAAGEVRARHRASRGGRPRKPRFARSIEYAERAFADESAAFGDLEALASMSVMERAELARRLTFVRQRCEELASRIGA